MHIVSQATISTPSPLLPTPAHLQMRLRPNPIDQLHPTAIDLIHELDHRLHLRVVGVQVEVVDVELCVRVGAARGVEREWDVGRVEGVEKDVGTEGAVVVERFCAGESAQVQRTGNTE